MNDLIFFLSAGSALVYVLATCCSPFVAVVSALRAYTARRVFYKKVAAQLACMAFVMGTVALGIMWIAGGIPLPDSLPAFFIAQQPPLFWPVLIESAVVGCAASGAFGALWMALLRNRQDYGRDYYAFALPYCARWALWGTGCAMPVALLMYFQAKSLMPPELAHNPPQLLLALACVCPVPACLLWMRIIASQTPMRHKISIVLALLLLMAAVSGQLSVMTSIFPR